MTFLESYTLKSVQFFEQKGGCGQLEIGSIETEN